MLQLCSASAVPAGEEHKVVVQFEKGRTSVQCSMPREQKLLKVWQRTLPLISPAMSFNPLSCRALHARSAEHRQPSA
jgi:hypothetical protein